MAETERGAMGDTLKRLVQRVPNLLLLLLLAEWAACTKPFLKKPSKSFQPPRPVRGGFLPQNGC